MQLKTLNGNLTLGSVYKLFVVGWLVSWNAMYLLVASILVAVTLVTGEMMVNGVMVHDRVQALLAMIPILILFPIVVAIQAFMFAAFLTFGVWLYRKRRPLSVVAQD